LLRRYEWAKEWNLQQVYRPTMPRMRGISRDLWTRFRWLEEILKWEILNESMTLSTTPTLQFMKLRSPIY